MNRSELDLAVAESADVDRATVSAVLDHLDRVLVSAARGGDAVTWSGLLTLDVVTRAARSGRNPQTGEALDIPESQQVRLRPGTRLKRAVRD